MENLYQSFKGCVAWGALHTISGWFSRFSMSFYLTGPNMSSLWPCCQKLWPDKKVLTFWVGKLLFWESLLLCDVCKSHTGFCSLRIYKTHTISLTGSTNHPQTKRSFSFLKSRWGVSTIVSHEICTGVRSNIWDWYCVGCLLWLILWLFYRLYSSSSIIHHPTIFCTQLFYLVGK